MANVHCGCSKTLDMTRRELLQWSGKGLVLGTVGMSLSNMLSLRDAHGFTPENPHYDACLTVYFDGGPTHIDTWDPKPGSQNNVFPTINLGINDTRGEPIHLSEVFPTIAGLAQNNGSGVSLGLIRSMFHNSNNHGNGQMMMNNFWRGALGNFYPSTASAMAYYFQGQGIGIPSVVINGANGNGVNDSRGAPIPTALQVDTNNNQGNNPTVEALELPPGVDLTRYNRRKDLLDQLNARFLGERPDAIARDIERATEDAFSVTEQGDAARAFDLTGKPLLPARNNNDARRITLAQELLKAGIPYVSVGIGGNDTHNNNMQRVRDNWGTTFDQGIGQLAQNLQATGKRVLIMAYGDFGRTPNTTANGRDGRDHWGHSFSVAMISVNQPNFTTNSIGFTGPDGMYRQRDGNLVDEMEPKDLGGFFYRSMGIPIGAPDGRADLPVGTGRDAPPVDRINKGIDLQRTFGLIT